MYKFLFVLAEDADDKYFALKPEPSPAPKPRELGVENSKFMNFNNECLYVEWCNVTNMRTLKNLVHMSLMNCINENLSAME